jgi:hypothetical protein
MLEGKDRQKARVQIGCSPEKPIRYFLSDYKIHAIQAEWTVAAFAEQGIHPLLTVDWRSG